MASANDVVRLYEQRVGAYAKLRNAESELVALKRLIHKTILLMAGDICESVDAAFNLGNGLVAIVWYDESGEPETRITELFHAVEEQDVLKNAIKEAANGPSV